MQDSSQEHPPIAGRAVLRSREDSVALDDDLLIEEVPVALVYNGISHAVMLASPADLEDFALGFSLGEGVVATPGEIHDLEIVENRDGIAIEMRIATPRFLALKEQRRSLAGRTGCGLCGLDSLAAMSCHAAAAASPPPATRVAAAAIDEALHQLPHWQPLREATGASHGAAWVDAEGQILCLREDVGRHNALDKLIGALARERRPLDGGFTLITSRASYEMVQKVARAGIGALVAVSAPTALAVRQAEAAGLLLVGFARHGRRVAYCHGERLDHVPMRVASQSLM